MRNDHNTCGCKQCAYCQRVAGRRAKWEAKMDAWLLLKR